MKAPFASRLNTFFLLLCAACFALACNPAGEPAADTATQQSAQAVEYPEVSMASDYAVERQDYFDALENFYNKESITPEEVNNVFIQLTEAALSLAQAYDPAENPQIAEYAADLRASYAQIDAAALANHSKAFAPAAVDLSQLLKELSSRYYPKLTNEADLLHRGAVRLVPEQPILTQDYPINTFFQAGEKILSGMSSPVVEVEAETSN
jgi:hypothetical protein